MKVTILFFILSLVMVWLARVSETYTELGFYTGVAITLWIIMFIRFTGFCIKQLHKIKKGGR